jgi:hypothetical protein
LRQAFSLDCAALFLIIFCSVELSIAVHLGTLRGPVGWRASAAEMRNKSCPIVTFQTERKGGFELIAAGAIEIDAQRRGAHVACGPTAPPAW